MVLEHNPLDPVTRYVVARTPIDRDAIQGMSLNQLADYATFRALVHDRW